MVATTPLETTVETVIFVSYLVISCVVLVTYIKHKNYLDCFVNRLLAINFGLFLMLCAFTHLYSIFSDDVNVPLSTSCAVVSFIAVLCTLRSFKALDDYLLLRISTSEFLRERAIQELTQGYDLRCYAVDNQLVEGSIKGYSGGFPVTFDGGTQTGSIIQIGSSFFRVVSSIEEKIDLNLPQTYREISDEEVALSSSFGVTIYGYDATAEVHMSREEERMNDMKMAMCMGTAHDVRTPLSSLGIVVSSLRSMGDNKDEEFVKLLDEAFVNIEILNLVATQFMEIGRLGTTIKVKPTISVLDVATMVLRARKVCSRLKHDNVETRCEVRQGVPNSLLTDVEWIWQILMNLITNAAKYTYKGRIDVLVDYQDERLELRVADTGIGIDDENKKHVFDKFVTHQKYTHDSHGIGLHSVKAKVDTLGGSCEILDNPGGGTIFKVKIPAKVNKDTVDDVIEDGGPTEEAAHTVRTCLIVDDTVSIRKMMGHLLQDHDVTFACNGAEGLEKLKETTFDIALLDVSMPVMDGKECLTRFREWERAHRNKRQLIYSMSANVLEVTGGFDGSLPKPIDSYRLRRLLRRGSTKVHPIEEPLQAGNC